MERIARKIGEKTVEAELMALVKEFLPVSLEIDFDIVNRKDKEKEGKWFAIMLRPKKNK